MAISRTRASLRITGTAGTTADLSAALGLAPTSSHDIGDPRSKRDPRPWAHLRWSLRSDLDDDTDLGEHLSGLCDRMESRAATLRELAERGYELDWFCFLELEENGQGGLTLDAGLLGRLGALPVDLTLDLYG